MFYQELKNKTKGDLQMKANIKRKNFKGEVIYVGMDVHKHSWMITIVNRDIFIKRFSQEPGVGRLSRTLRKMFPDAIYKCVYEAGYCGFWIAEELLKEGIECIVVNPADIPVTNKDKDRKTDKADSRKLAELLRTDLLRGIYIPNSAQLEDRALLRIRSILTWSQSATKTRIKAFLTFYNINIPEEQLSKYWAKNYVSYLKTIKLTQNSGQQAFSVLLRQLDYYRAELLAVTRSIRELARTDKYKDQVKRLVSIPGIGVINALTLLTEIEDIDRFSCANKFRGFIGLVPKEHSSGERVNKSSISKRGNKRIKTMLIESAWTAVRTDPAMTLAFEQLTGRLNKSRAIIRIAAKLANRIRHVLVAKEEYVYSVAQ